MPTKLPSRIDQIVSTLVPHDAVGNHALIIQHLLRERGYMSEIFTEPRPDFEQPGTLDISKFTDVASDSSMTIYHYSTGTDIGNYLHLLPSFKVTDFHNITPPHFFGGGHYEEQFHGCLRGHIQMPLIRAACGYAWAHSQFSANDLLNCGYSDVATFPVLRRYDKFRDQPNAEPLFSVLNDGRKNIIFAGRIVPNKAQHDLIFAFRLYKEIDPDARLILVGSYNLHYLEAIVALGAKFGLRMLVADAACSNAETDVLILSGVSDGALSTVYKTAHLFLCLSDHEGYCVPAVEAIHFGIPIVAHNAGAVPETIGAGGIICNKNDVETLIGSMYLAIADPASRERLRSNAAKVAAETSMPELVKHFDRALAKALASFAVATV